MKLETPLIIKTRESLFSKLKRVITENYPYQVPEIVAFHIDRINKNYLNWLIKETDG
ncbi:MAG: hypothetical protein DRP68_07165 [Candidatus Omnitrophota bacterium]|nr:MAG: hypothetical protein DRP68_07165 [Candidatus Omnitrophota bacterium]RKY38819.1 MAG: hypothetical protein DRP72_01125 [Candidatus Omnitrophota bacterium]RKY45987.1 MAG: hypothetical protein DRP81_02045 [Candidatus Omnitrophota bacterium]